MSAEKSFFTRVNELLKPYRSNAVVNQDEIDSLSKVKDYLDTLPLDKRKIAVGGDVFIWFADNFSRVDSIHRDTEGYRYGDGIQETAFLIKNPTKSLLTTPVWSLSFARTVAERSDLTLINDYQLNLLERVVLTEQEIEDWNYQVISRQQAEASEGGPFDFISLSSYNIVHDPSLVLSYFNMLNDNGVMLITWANDNGNLYETDAEYSPYFEINQHLKSLENVCVSHDYTSLGTTTVVKL
jgi:hypothetical protein